ncbi:hypothetical protein C4K01_3508 [Pseudomonas synxantha]|nr:hypothetical protein C4K01_3508 [Pseudomonas synxantha]
MARNCEVIGAQRVGMCDQWGTFGGSLLAAKATELWALIPPRAC